VYLRGQAVRQPGGCGRLGRQRQLPTGISHLGFATWPCRARASFSSSPAWLTWLPQPRASWPPRPRSRRGCARARAVRGRPKRAPGQSARATVAPEYPRSGLSPPRARFRPIGPI
jgi:hypothetical protein